MEVDTWSDDWGLPSIDPECLKVLAFAKFSGAPLQQKPTNNPFWTPKGNLPVFRHNGATLTDFQSISKHLRACNYSADYNLSAKQLSESNAFIQMMDEKLAPALKYIMWIDTKNHIEFTRLWYGKHLPFPHGLYYPNRFEKAAVQLIDSLYGNHSEYGELGNDTPVETCVYKEAQECLTLLSHRLGNDSPYLFGRSPSSADAVMYGYLAPLLKAPLPNAALQNYLKECSNLAAFVVRISQHYFPKVVKAFEDRQRGEEEQQQQQKAKQKRDKKQKDRRRQDDEGSGDHDSDTDDAWPNQTRDKVVAGLVATTAMLGYAYTSGLVDIVRNIEIRIGSDEEEEFEDEEDEEQDEQNN